MMLKLPISLFVQGLFSEVASPMQPKLDGWVRIGPTSFCEGFVRLFVCLFFVCFVFILFYLFIFLSCHNTRIPCKSVCPGSFLKVADPTEPKLCGWVRLGPS